MDSQFCCHMTGWNSSGGSQQSLASPSTLSTTSSPDSEDGSPTDQDRLSPQSAAFLEEAAVRRKYSLQEECLLSVPRHEELEMRRNSTGSAAPPAFHLAQARFLDAALAASGDGGDSMPGPSSSSLNIFDGRRASCHSPSSPRPKSPTGGVGGSHLPGGVHLPPSSLDPSRLKVENYHHHLHPHNPFGGHPSEATSPGAPSPSGGGGVPPWQKQTIQLWQFLRELLMEPQNYSCAIRWVDKQKGWQCKEYLLG